jgi:hypothetical protein
VRAEREQVDAGLPAQLVVDVTADPERQIDVLRLKSIDLPAEQLRHRDVVGAWRAEQLLVAVLAADPLGLCTGAPGIRRSPD